MKKIPAAPGRAVVFARSPPAGAFAGFVLSLSLISRPPPFSACRTAFPARRRRKPASGRSTAPYRCCPRSGGCRCRRKDPAGPANRMNRSDQSNRLALRFPLQGWLQSAHIHRPHSRALWNLLRSRWPLWLLSNQGLSKTILAYCSAFFGICAGRFSANFPKIMWRTCANPHFPRKSWGNTAYLIRS